MRAPYKMFGKTLLVRVETWTDGKKDQEPKTRWDDSMWSERGEDMYALMSDWAKGRTIRVVHREDWLNARADAAAGALERPEE